MTFGIFLLVIANLANGYLLNSIPLEKLMQKAMTAGKRSEVKNRIPTIIFLTFRRWWNVEQLTHRLHIKSQCGYSKKLTETLLYRITYTILRIKIFTILFINKTFACIFEIVLSVKSIWYCYKFADFRHGITRVSISVDQLQSFVWWDSMQIYLTNKAPNFIQDIQLIFRSTIWYTE